MVHLFNVPPSSCADSNARRNLRRKGRVITGLIASLLVGALATAAASCADGADGERDARASAPGSDTTSPASVAAQAPHVSAPLDLAGVMKRVHFSFRRDDSGAFSGGHTSYEVRTSAGGISVTPGRTDVDRDPKTNTLPAEAIGAPVNFETVSLGRGAALHDAPLGEPRVAEAGHLILPRGEFEEQFENTEEGVEQRFAFAKRPEGRGDLVIRVRVSGEEYAGETENGHHFVDSATGIGLRYGLATWIDATGERTALRVDYRYDAGALELTVPEDVLEGSAYPAVLDPYISPEMGTDNPILGFVNGDQWFPDVAFDGANYMAVWIDSGRKSVYATRVSPGGAVLSPDAILVRTNANVGSTKPAIAFNGTNFLVAWSEDASTQYNVHVVRLSPTGTILGSPTQIATPIYDDATDPDIAFDGTNCLVVYATEYSAGDLNISAQRVSPTGAAVGSIITISGANVVERTPTVAFDGTNYFVAWHDRRNNTAGDIYGARVTKTGSVLDPTGIAISTAANAQSEPDIAFDGTNYLIVWDDAKWGGGRDIYGAYVTPAGVVQNPTGFEISKSAGDETTPGIAFDGTRYVVAWGDTRNGNADVYAARVLPGGVVLDPMGIQVTSNAASQNDLNVACGGGNCLMVFADQRAPMTPVNSDIWGARINGSGTVLDPDGFPISRSVNEQVNPVVVRGTGQYLAVWQDHRAISNWDIYGTRIDSSGNAIDSSGIPISTAVGDQLEPDVSWNGTDWFVAWEDRRNAATGDIYGARVDGTGTVLDPSGFTISATTYTERQAAVAFDGTNHMVVWNDSRTSSGDIYGVRVSMTGAVVDANAILLGQTSSEDVYPEIAFDATNYLVAWYRPTIGRVLGRRLTPAGTLLDSVNGFNITQGGGVPIDVVYDGLNFFAVTSYGGTIYGGRVTSAGVALEPNGFTIAGPAGGFQQSHPGITRDGQGVFVAWRSTNSTTSENMIRGTWITQAGDFSHVGGFIISNTPSFDHRYPAAAADGAGNVLVAYQRNAMNGIGAEHERTYVRLISALTTGMPCTDNAACLSGFCVDGVCCASACGGGDPNDCLGCSVAVGAAVDGTCSALNAVPCSDGNGCTTGDTCMTGVCMSGGPNPCSAQDSCHLDGVCNMATGMCTNPVKADGSTCDDGNGCTQADSCQTGVCVGANPVVCPQDTQCNIVSACDPMTGACPVANEPDGMACDDGNECSQTSVCQNGVCLGSNYTVCPPPDPCHLPGMCEPSLGTCSYDPKPNGTACNDDNACTLTDTCQAGACVGVNSPCPATTDCAIVSPCDPGTGTCTVTNEPDGKACSDGNACTQMDTCLAGQCVGGSPVVCPPPAQCKQPGVCDAGAGQCVYPNEINGVACDDGNACTMVDFCVAGACTSGTPIVCAPLDDCHDAGSCNSATGVCSNPAKPDGAACPGGVCMAGICELAPDGGQSSSSSGGGGASSSSGAGGKGGGGASSSSGVGGKGGGGASSSSGAGGASGEGGSGASGEGGSGTSGGTAPADPGDCGCRTVHTKSNVTPISALGAVTLLLSRRRRRTRVN